MTSTVQIDVPAGWPLLEAVAARPEVRLLSPPHVTLAWRWLPAPAARAATSALGNVLAGVEAFPLTFSHVAAFPPDGRGRVVVYAVPDDPAPLRALAGAVEAVAGKVPPPADWRPHLSVARIGAGGPVASVMRRTSGQLPLRTVATAVHLHVQEGGKWRSAGDYRLALA